MRSPLKISFCTVSKNRLHHIKETLLQNMRDNEDYSALEFVLLNYNSEDELDHWVQEHMRIFYEQGRFCYYKTTEPDYFDRSHSRNMIFRLATGKILCNLDADNFTGPGFASYIYEQWEQMEGPGMLIRSPYLQSEEDRNAYGRICVDSDSFHRVHGFDERMKGYGFEDTDLIKRLQRYGVVCRYITEPVFLKGIAHGHSLRIKEEPFLKQHYLLLIRYLDAFHSELLFLNNQHHWEQTELIDTGLLRFICQEDPQMSSPLYKDYDLCFKDNKWQQGTWQKNGAQLILKNPDGRMRCFLKRSLGESTVYEQQGEEAPYYPIADSLLIEELLYLYPQIKNRIIMDESEANGQYVANPMGYGKGRVIDYFNGQEINIQ